MSIFKLYLLFSVIPSFSGFFTFIAIIQAIAFIGFFLIGGEIFKDFIVERKKQTGIFIAVFVISAMLSSLLPDQTTMVKMYVANYVTTNNQIKQLPKVVIEYLKKETKEGE